MAKISLNDNWEVSGTDFDELVEVTSELTKMTKHRKTSTAELLMLLGGYTTSGTAMTISLTHDLLEEYEEFKSIELDAKYNYLIPKNEYSKELYEESVAENGFMIQERGQTFYTSKTMMSSLLARCLINGQNSYFNCCLRNTLIAYLLYKRGIGDCGNGRHEPRCTYINPDDQNVTLVYREIKEGGKTLRKIFYMPTEKYTPVPLMVVPETAERICDDDILGEPTVKYWFVNHEIVEACIVFPEIAEETAEAYEKLPDQVLPGILLRSSDTGKSCVDVKAVAFIGKSQHYITLETKKRKHTGEVDVDSFVEEANEAILENVRILPELLAKMTENVIYEAGAGKTRMAKVRNAISKAFRHCGLTKIIGKKREKELKTALFTELNLERDYTEYDVAAMIMKIGDRISNVTHFMRDQLGEACAKAPYAFKNNDDDEELYLLPEEE